MTPAVILGIETSCDETAAAVVRGGAEILSNVIFSQIAVHQQYGGVVPELASREHLRAIVPVTRKAIADAAQSYRSIDAVAVTQGPGLAGALLVGISYAKALAFALQKPLIAVNHLEGHIHAVLLEERQNGNRSLNFPVIALVVSGGHTHLYLIKQNLIRQDSAGRIEEIWSYENIGRTRDDAAGEAFDKVAKLLGLGYPGGPVIDKLAPYGDPAAVKFSPPQLKHRDRNESEDGRAGIGQDRAQRFDFSYSGIKTAVLRYVEANNLRPEIDARRNQLGALGKPALEDFRASCDQKILNLIASFQRTMVEDLTRKTLAAARHYQAATLLVTGGVAANQDLRRSFEVESAPAGLQVYFPSRPLATDNAAMIAAAAYPKFVSEDFASLDFSAEPGMPLK